MCGRFGQSREDQELMKRFNIPDAKRELLKDPELQDLQEQFELASQPNINTDIGSFAFFVAEGKSGRNLYPGMFGYNPVWMPRRPFWFNARTEGKSAKYNTGNDPNYQGELGIFKEGAFVKGIKGQRCVIPVDHFFEGPMKEKLKKPFLIHRKDGEPLNLAGIWTKSDGHLSFAILTTTPQSILQQVGHHRSPVMLNDDAVDDWLNRDTGEPILQELLRPYTFNETVLEAYPVNPQVGKNNKKHDNMDASLLAPIGEVIESAA